MKQLQIIFIILLSVQFGFSQNKQIEGDTIYWYKYAKELENEIQLNDFEQSKNDFVFRFRNYGQVVEIMKDSTSFSGTITNYVYYRKKRGTDSKTLFNKENISTEQAKQVYNLIKDTQILDLPSDKDINGWQQGTDGTIYILEYADKSTYSFKHYWSPHIQEVPEAKKFQNFIAALSDMLRLNRSHQEFEDNLPKRSGFYNVGSIASAFKIYSGTSVGYSGATKLPFGFFANHFTSYIGRNEVNLGGSIQYNFDGKGFHHLNFQLSKSRIFYKQDNFDYVAYTYQDRKINIAQNKKHFQNHQIQYGIHFKNFGVGAGVDYLMADYEKVGGSIFLSKWFSVPEISSSFSTSIFANQFNYKIALERLFNFNDRFPLSNIYLNLTYEKYLNYNDLYFGIYTSF